MDPGKSQLLNSLKAYLNNKSRLQPIIGLGTIIECVNVSSRTRETTYLCEVCVCRLTKADMRNHIMGSHHRFNYIKASHSHLVSQWVGSPDLSKLAWPLMELAKVLEKNEGPGHVQLIEVQEELYQIIATQSVDHAITLMKTVKQEQPEKQSFPEMQPLHHPVVSQRIVLPARNQWQDPETFDSGADIKPPQTSQQMELQAPLKNKSTPLEVEMSTVRDSDGLLDDFPEAKPLIGFARVVEFRSEDGSSYCFLCHCCRIRSSQTDLIDHISSSSHIVNYLMEMYPKQIEALGGVTEDDDQLQSLAANIEEEEGRGEMKIVDVPESICSQLTGKSYHWCLNMLSSGWEHPNIEPKRKAFRDVNKITAPHVPRKGFVVTSKQEKRGKLLKKKCKKTITMFNVSLPIGEGELLLERRSFDMDRLFESPSSVPSCPELVDNRSLTDWPELQKPELEQHVYLEDADSAEYMSENHITVTVFQDRKGYAGDDLSGLDKLNGSQECESKDWRCEDLQTQSGRLFPARPHSEEFLPYMSNYREGSCGSCFWYSSASDGAKGQTLRLEGEPSVLQHQNQPPSWSDSHPDSMWEHQVVPYLKAVRTNAEAHSGHSPVYRGSMSSDPRGQSHEAELRRGQTYPTDHHQTALQRYTNPPAAFGVSPVQQGLFYAYDDALPHTHQGTLPHPNSSFMYPVPDQGSGWTQDNAFIEPGQAVCYAPSSAVYFRAGIHTEFTDSHYTC